MSPEDRYHLKWLAGGAAVVGLFVGGYALGIHAKPDRVVTHDVEHVRLVEDTEARERVRELTQQLETFKRHTRSEHTTVTHVDGSKEEKVITDTHVDRINASRSDSDVVKVESKHVDASRVTVSDKTTERARPSWRLGPLVAFDLRTRGLSYGGQVERRILGPVSLGAFGLSTGVAGLSLTLEF